jgi:ubiquinone/menaquinone biosynthesis C-methylase UbiE
MLDSGTSSGHVAPRRDLSELERAWRTLAAADPLWAICVDPAARHGRWDRADFYAGGAAEVAQVLAQADLHGLVTGGDRVLDFGCGAGRLTRPLAERFALAVGVDITEEMLELAEQDNPVASRCRFVRNTAPDLAQFGDGEFDMVYSSIVLQHLTPALTQGYLAEFARVLRPGGSLICQLPTRPRWTPRGMCYRFLPPSVLDAAQRRVLGYPAPMRMLGMPESGVRSLLAANGVAVLATETTRYHPDWHELRYYGRKSCGASSG